MLGREPHLKERVLSSQPAATAATPTNLQTGKCVSGSEQDN